LDQELQPKAVAETFEKLARKEGDVDLIILGKQSIDGDNCATGPMLAAYLGWPQCTFAASLAFEGKVICGERETDTGTEDISFPLPAVVTTDLRLNEPRYPTLPNIMKAKKKPVETFTAKDLNIDLSPRNVVIEVNEPPLRKAGVTVENIDDLIEKLKNEAKVI
jgi:electron transfer flavoprotein beta subunit